jgi:uncharacterized protein (TIGR02611 family)
VSAVARTGAPRWLAGTTSGSVRGDAYVRRMTSEIDVAAARLAEGQRDYARERPASDGRPFSSSGEGGASPESDARAGHAPQDGPASRARARWRSARDRLDSYPRLRVAYKVGVALVGVLVVAVGLVLVPLPGPGWLIVFVGVAVLGTEFPAAHRVTQAVRRVARRLRLRWRAWRANRSAARA